MASGAFLAISFCTYAILFVTFIWFIVPTRQSVRDPFPNVVIVMGTPQPIESITFDNVTMPEVDGANLLGLYSHNPLFFHKTLERFISWEERPLLTIWQCTFWCSPPREDSKLILIHYEKEEKKNLFYILDVKDEANSPVIYARTKQRKVQTFDTSFVSVMPVDEKKKEKPKSIGDWKIVTAWHLFHFDSTEKIVTVVCAIIAFLIWYYLWKRDSDDDD